MSNLQIVYRDSRKSIRGHYVNPWSDTLTLCGHRIWTAPQGRWRRQERATVTPLSQLNGDCAECARKAFAMEVYRRENN